MLISFLSKIIGIKNNRKMALVNFWSTADINVDSLCLFDLWFSADLRALRPNILISAVLLKWKGNKSLHENKSLKNWDLTFRTRTELKLTQYKNYNETLNIYL